MGLVLQLQYTEYRISICNYNTHNMELVYGKVEFEALYMAPRQERIKPTKYYNIYLHS